MTDVMTNLKTAQGVAKTLERVFPQGGALAAINVMRVEAFAKVKGPADLLRLMADRIDPPKKAKRKPAAKKAKKAA